MADSTLTEDPFLNLDEESTSQDDPPLHLEIENPCTFDEYVAVDDEIQCAPLPTNEDIVSSVRQTSEEADENDWRSIATCYIAYFALQEIAVVSLPSENLYRLLGDLETELFKARSSTCVITDFFQ